MISLVRKTAKLLLQVAPRAWRDRLHGYAERAQARRAVERMRRFVVSKQEIAEAIGSLELDHRDVMLHTSIVNIGRIRGGVGYLAGLFEQKADTDRHTLLVSALPYRGSTKEYLESEPVFDLLHSPICTGSINEALGARPSALRSLHPTHSVVALGPDASFFVSGHHLDGTPFGEHSPYYRLILRRGKVVLFGATLNNLTLIHAVEDMLGGAHPFPVYLKREYAVRCVDASGMEHTVLTRCHSPFRAVFRDVARLREGLIERRIMQVVPVGDSEIAVIDACGFARYYLELLSSGKSVYGSHRVKPSLRRAVADCLERLGQELKD